MSRYDMKSGSLAQYFFPFFVLFFWLFPWMHWSFIHASLFVGHGGLLVPEMMTTDEYPHMEGHALFSY